MITLSDPSSSGFSFSVIIPAYNRRHTIEATIASVLAQTSPVQEIIVIDDGSTDGTLEILRSFEDRGVTIVANSSNLGAPESRNRGAKLATSEWIAFLDSDDVWLPGKIAADRAVIAHLGDTVDVIASNHVDVIEGIPGLFPTRKESYLDPEKALRVENFLGTCSSMTIRRRHFEAIGGFDAGLQSCQDWDIWLRAVSVGQLAVAKPTSVHYTVSSGNNISYDGRRRRAGHVFMWRAYIRPEADNLKARATLAVTFADIAFNLDKRKSFLRMCLYALKRNRTAGMLAAIMLLSAVGIRSYGPYRTRVLANLNRLRALRLRLSLLGLGRRQPEAVAVLSPASGGQEVSDRT